MGATPTHKPYVYLDNNATTLIAPEVVAAMKSTMDLRLANPSSQHQSGRVARRIIENARDSILHACGARTSGMASDQLVFTSGGTESNNLAIFGLTEDRPGAIVVSNIEHPSVLAAAEYASKMGRQVWYLKSGSNGVVSLDELKRWLSDHSTDPIALVSLMAANNETGVMQPIEQAAALCRKAGVLIHTDAVQVLGKRPMSFASYDVDAMTITAHKLHGPVGIGGLMLRHGVSIKPTLFGGFQQLGLRPGTENPLLAVGFDVAINRSLQQLEENTMRMGALRDRLQRALRERLPNSVVIGDQVDRLPHTLSISFPGIDRQAIQLALDQKGVACSTGSACASGSSQPSHVLQAMGLEQKVVHGGVRFSLSRETSENEIHEAIEIIKQTIRQLSV